MTGFVSAWSVSRTSMQELNDGPTTSDYPAGQLLTATGKNASMAHLHALMTIESQQTRRRH